MMTYVSTETATYHFYAFTRLVTSLEAVVVQLQDSCRESRTENADLRQENGRLANTLETLKHESREREKYFRAFWHGRKGSEGEHRMEEFPPPPTSFNSMPGSSSSSLGTPVSTPHPHASPYPISAAENLDPRLQYQAHAHSPVSMTSNVYHHEGPASAYGDRSPSMPFVNHEGEPVGANGRPLDPNRMKMGHYTMFNMQSAARDTGWPPGVNHSASSESIAQENGSASHSPAFIPSPNVTATEIPYGSRYPMMENHKTVLPSIDTVPYMLSNANNDRSISPAASSPHTGSSTSVSSHFQFVFPSESQERTADPEFRRHLPPEPMPKPIPRASRTSMAILAAPSEDFLGRVRVLRSAPKA